MQFSRLVIHSEVIWVIKSHVKGEMLLEQWPELQVMVLEEIVLAQFQALSLICQKILLLDIAEDKELTQFVVQ